MTQCAEISTFIMKSRPLRLCSKKEIAGKWHKWLWFERVVALLAAGTSDRVIRATICGPTNYDRGKGPLRQVRVKRMVTFFKNKMAYYLSGNTVFWIISRYKNANGTTIRNVIIAGYTLFLVGSYIARFKLQL